MRSRIRLWVVALATVLAIPFSAGSASAATYFSSLFPNEGGASLASGYGYFDYASNGDPHQNTVLSDWQNDGDPAYGRAQFQQYQRIYNPNTNYYYYRWNAIYEEQTARYHPASGWVTTNLYTGRRTNLGTSWRDIASVCIDQAWQFDPCASTNYLYP